MRLFDREAWREVAHTLGANKRRSLVTAFGVFWGTFMLMVLLSLSNGFRHGIEAATRGVATSMAGLYVAPTSLPYDGLPAGYHWRMYRKDLDYIRAFTPEIKAATGFTTLWNGQTGVMAEGKKDDAGIVAVDEHYFDIFFVRLLSGRLLRESDHRDSRKHCLLGKSVATKLFGSTRLALGKSIRSSYGNYTVVGVVESVSTMVNVGPSVQSSVYIPYCTVEQKLKPVGSLGQIAFSFYEGVDRQKAMERIKDIVKATKRISPKDKKAVGFFDLEEVLGLFEGINLGLNILVWIIGIGTLLTGVVGISNIMLVTVKERTQEIGVRRALGAKPRDIVAQLLMEAISLTLLAGIIGIVLGVGLMSVVSQVFTKGSNFPFERPMVELSVVLFSLGIIVLGGVLAGLIPALKAVEIKAIEAIREE